LRSFDNLRNATSPESPGQPRPEDNGRRMANGTIADTRRVGRHIVPFVTGRSGFQARPSFRLSKFWSKASVIEGKPHACIALCHRFLKLRDQGEPYTSTPQFGSPLIRIKSMPDTPLSRLPRLSRRYSGSPESSIAGPACFGLSQLSQLSSHISTTEPKRAEDLKENAALRIPSKGPKRSNFIEFYKNRRLNSLCHGRGNPDLVSLVSLIRTFLQRNQSGQRI
jgi:hypothetical protein